MMMMPKRMVIEIMIIGDENLYKSVSKLVKYLGRVVSRHNGICVGAPCIIVTKLLFTFCDELLWRCEKGVCVHLYHCNQIIIVCNIRYDGEIVI